MLTVSNCHYRQTISAKRTNARHLFLSVAVSFLVGGLFLQPRTAHADNYVPGTTIYLVTESGLIDVTMTYSSTNSTVLDDLGLPVVIILSYHDGHVINIHGDIIGILE